MNDIYLHIVARMVDYMATHPYARGIRDGYGGGMMAYLGVGQPHVGAHKLLELHLVVDLLAASGTGLVYSHGNLDEHDNDIYIHATCAQ